MNQYAEEMLAIIEDPNYIAHYGIKRRSGRYPWGSGDDPYQRTGDFLSRVEELKKNGWEETPENIKKEFGLTTTQYRTEKAICKDERRLLLYERARALQDDGKGPSEIARIMGLPNESSARSLLDVKAATRMAQARNTADFIKKQIDSKGIIDIGAGVEAELGISKEKLNQALYLLEREGYEIRGNRIPQATNKGKYTTQKVICPPGTPKAEIFQWDKIHALNEDNFISRDGGDTFEKKFNYPSSMDSKRLMIRYKEDGGIDMDGIVQLRRGVEDLSLGESKYSQVRILVDNDRYIKGMAVYADDKEFPPGVDVIFNTNKSKSVAMRDVLKEIKNDPENPFGSAIKDADQGGQYWYKDSKTGEKKLGLINKRADEGDWSEWSNGLPAQFLSKQPESMIKKQLNIAKTDKLAEYDEICSLSNPTVKKHLLEKFADTCDAAAVDLKAAALPGQKYHVIIPVNTLKDDEVYAPGYEQGSKLALIRYPHGGTFEIPICTVNNRNATAKKLIGNDTLDAVCINSKVAERLSGADFDGDTVMCIPTHDRGGKVKIAYTPRLKELIGFDGKLEYGPAKTTVDADGSKHYFDGSGREYRIMTKKGTQTEMGKISNLITDMTLFGADEADLAKAVKHSMVVIDANKHKLDYKRSEVENDIATLNKKYRSYIDENGVEQVGTGAATIISKSKGQYSVNKRQGSYKINIPGKEYYDPTRPDGAKLWNDADDLYYPIKKYNKDTGIMEVTTTSGKKVRYNVKDQGDKDKYEPVPKKDPVTGKVIGYTNKAGDIEYKLKTRTQESTKMAETDDAMELVSRRKNPKELAYAEYANDMKALANKARLEMANSGKIAYDRTAKETYKQEVKSLEEKLRNAEMNRTKERAAQRKANAEINAKKLANPNMDNDDLKKASQRALTKYRQEVGSVSRRNRDIEITDREWQAIQAGAISETQLKKILNNTNIDKLRERATPRTNTKSASSAQVARMKAMSASYTIQEIADKFGMSPSAVSKYLKST